MKDFYATPSSQKSVFFPPLESSSSIDESLHIDNPARIAVYDDLLSAPRVITIEPKGIRNYLDEISMETYKAASGQGGSLPFTVIEQVVENFIHAYFREPTISIIDKGNTIRFTDQGPGISNKEIAQQVGVTSASQEMKDYIRGVGSGLPTVKEYLTFQGGRLTIEDNINSGTIVTISMNIEAEEENLREEEMSFISIRIDDDQLKILRLFMEFEFLGPTELNEHLGIANSTGSRKLKDMADQSLIRKTNIKYTLTSYGRRYYNSL